MKSFSKIAVIFFAVLISYINSGLLMSSKTQQILNNLEQSYPSSDRFSIQNIFLCPFSDLILKTTLVQGNTDKFIQKIKIPWGLRSGAIIIKNHQYLLKSEDKNPTLIADLFGPPDISFPFNYFW